MTTPSGARIVLISEDGQTSDDVTEEVGALFDLATRSMNWQSGFLTVDDAEPVVRIADLAGYADPDAHMRDWMLQRQGLVNGGPTLMEQARAQVRAAEGHE